MKILLGNNTLDYLAGSETYTLTLAAELKRLGHDVMAYSPQLGFIATQLEGLGIKCVSEFKKGGNRLKFSLEMPEEDDYDFDVIICAHHQITKNLHAFFPEVPIIGIVHGILHKDPNTGEIWPEHPVVDYPPGFVGPRKAPTVAQYVAVSEEVQGLLKEVHGIDSVVLRNFFDLEKFSWKPIPPESGTPGEEETIARRRPTNILINTNYADKTSPEVEFVRKIADHYNAQLRAVGVNFSASWDMEKTMDDVDLVVGMGRSVLEGFAMGKIALVLGRWGVGGVITPKTYDTLKKTNFSGRESGNSEATPEDIIKMIDEALTLDQSNWQKKTVLENHDVKVVAQEFLKIAEKLKR